MLACWTTTATSSMLLSDESSFSTLVAAVIGETTGWSLRSHQSRFIVMVGYVASDTMSWENVTMCLPKAVLLE